jgi:hypothetical protein
MLEVFVSGAFRNNGEMIDFTDIKLVMPDCDEDMIKSNAINRCFTRQAEKVFKKRIDSINSLYVDRVKKNDKDVPSCCGKGIKTLDWDELQEFAIMYNLRGVPLFRSTDLRTARIKAFREYCEKILGEKQEDGYNWAAARDYEVPNIVSKRARDKGNAEAVLSGRDEISV